MAKSLNDTQRTILAAAAGRENRRALHFPDKLRAPPPAVAKTVESLIGSSLLAETPARAEDPVWREDEAVGKLTLIVTAAGLAAIGIEPDNEGPPAPAEATAGKQSKQSKQDIVVALLRRGNGASIKEIEEATGWLSHSVRGFMSGALKKRLKVDVVSTKDAETGERRYQIAALRTPKG